MLAQPIKISMGQKRIRKMGLSIRALALVHLTIDSDQAEEGVRLAKARKLRD